MVIFYEPSTKFPAFQYFRDIGAVEFFQWYHAKHGVQLPATCAGATRNDSAIFHPLVADRIYDKQVASEHQIGVHMPLFFQFFQFNHHRICGVKNTWQFPKTWAHFAPPSDTIGLMYRPLDFDAFFAASTDVDDMDMWRALQMWSRHVEDAIDRALTFEHKKDPNTFPQASLSSAYKGRCNFANITKSPSISYWLPDIDTLDMMVQVRQHDCHHACRDEARMRADAFRARMHIDQSDDYSRMSYRLIKAKETYTLAEVSVEKSVQGRLLRSRVERTA